MLIPQWTFLAVVSVSVLWESKCCPFKDFPLLPLNYGHYEGRTFDLVASTLNRDCECCRVKYKVGDYPKDFETDALLVVRVIIPHNGCNGDLTKANSCECANIYERDSWVLYVSFVPKNYWFIDLGSLNHLKSEKETEEYLVNWLEELNVPYHNSTDEFSILSCTRPTNLQKASLAWKLVVLIPVFLLVMSIITPTLKDYMARHSNRVHPFTS